MLRRHGVVGLAWLSLLLAACSAPPKVPPNPPPAVTPETHTWFPITAGSSHALGAPITEGVFACESCHPPAAESFTQFDCVSCHGHEQPVTQRLHLGVSMYAYQSPSCLSCHPAGAKVAFDHQGISDGCAQCHDTGAQFAALPVPGFTHPAMNGSDCGACHVTATWTTATGTPTGLSHDPGADVQLTALLATWSGTTIASVTPLAESLPMTMNHQSAEVQATAFDSCSNCHQGAAAGAFFPGLLHSSLANLTLAQPTACSSCHAAAAPTGFVGPTATSPARTPPSPEMKHDAVSWLNGAPTSATLVPGDCGVCHAAPGAQLPATWAAGAAGTSPALYHSALAAAAKPQPGSCLDCHANSRPVGRLTSTNSTLPATLEFDHAAANALGDCTSCHLKSALPPFASWSQGIFHLAGSANPTRCLPCHAAERPTATTAWTSTTYKSSPFDYVTNAAGITHGDGQDCATCHAGAGTGSWGGTQNWMGGHFTHGPATPSAATCVACHSTQRPDLQAGTTPAAMATLLGFDHSLNGSGDCFGCHQATVTANTYVNYLNPTTSMLPNGDWKGGVPYPGSTLASSSTQFITVTETSLTRSGANNLVTGSSAISATLYNGMLHTSAAVPAALNAGPTGMPDNSKCWHCHTNTNGTVTSFNNGKFHASLTNYSATPGGAVVPFLQPTGRCSDCHAQALPANIVQKAGSNLVPMDHAAQFAAPAMLGGATVTAVSQADCSSCHASPGVSFNDGLFHSKIGGATPKDCVGCHWLLMADATRADLTSATDFTMSHRSAQLTFQSCESCHTAALGKSTTPPAAAPLWKTGAYHPSLMVQPGACVDCHTVSRPAANASTQSTVTSSLPLGGTPTNGAQWMNHGAGSVVGKDCVSCHAADAKKTGSAWSRSDLLHPAVTPSSCQECHGLTNGGGAVAGTKNNLPTGLTNSSVLTSAGATTGVPATTPAQVLHTEVNVAGRDCGACHTQLGVSTAAGVQGKEWAQAKFHLNFGTANPLVINGTTGRCSNCHLSDRPQASFPGPDHSTFSATSQDCSACHSLPGTGSLAAPNWLGAMGAPLTISVGGFTVPAPPAPAPKLQTGIANLPHPSGMMCTNCHASSAGGKGANGYDHASALISSNCSACHEAGSNLVGSPWNNAVTAANGAGDTRPFTLGSLVAHYGSGLTVTHPTHFYGADCSQCHEVPTGTGAVTTGAAYTTAWRFPHTQSKMTNPGTCVMCHVNGIPGAPDGGVSDPNTNLTLTAQIPRYTGPSIVSLTAQSETLPMPMSHSSAQIPAAAFSSCTNCHAGATSSVYYPGELHSSLANLALAQPTACSSCHVTSMPTGFVGPVATSPARVPSSPEMKHDAVVWTNGAPTATAIVSTECSACHASPSATLQATWAMDRSGASPAKYHAPLAASQPASCLDCHANTRPDKVLTSANATLPPALSFDHAAAPALADCGSCHAKSKLSPWSSWTGGTFHQAGNANPTTCLPCHSGERPTTTTGWVSTTYKSSPFDYVTNANAITHGDGLDCVSCHPGAGTGAWGSTQNWAGGHFTHGAATVSGTTCIACHTTQRPDLQAGTTAAMMATLLGFDHSVNGTGDCAGCHQATTVANTYVNYFNPVSMALPNGDWKGGVSYPGSTLASASDQFITLTELKLNRSGANNLVTSVTSNSATLYNSMLHTSSALPAALNAGPSGNPDNTKCWHCHTNTNGTVTSFKNGKYHSALTTYAATPGGAVVPFPQPTSGCASCHLSMLPVGIVEKAASTLVPMDHSAQFATAVTLGGASVTAVNQADCSVCHASPGNVWSDGAFHSKIGAGTPKDCVTCHYPVMADTAKSDLSSGVNYAMKHGSTQLTFQSCETCHPSALSKAAMTPAAAPLWATGAYHPSLTTQPGVCLDCHVPSEPAANASTQSSISYTLPLGGTTTNAAQWMNHGSTYVTGKDCAVCHAADAKKTGAAWSKADLFHAPVPSTTTCNHCHGVTNGGGAVVGTKNNLPSGLTNSTTVTSAAGSTTGIAAGTLDQVTHSDVNVSSFECALCHTQAGTSTVAGIQGKEWAQAKFHSHFTGATALVMNTTTGRCSNCHLNVKPTAVFTGQNHSAFTAASGSEDCSSCHSWPGTGTATAPNWLGAAGMPQYLSVGGFTIPAPPASTPTTQSGITNLPHPTVVTGTACTTCHTTAAGGKPALGYDHKSTALIDANCNACHETGSNLVSGVWNGSTTQAAGAGNTRPFTINDLVPSFKGNTRSLANNKHFYPVNCYQCHRVSSTVTSFQTTGTTWKTAWKFTHSEGSPMSNPSTCNLCHQAGIPKG